MKISAIKLNTVYYKSNKQNNIKTTDEIKKDNKISAKNPIFLVSAGAVISGIILLKKGYLPKPVKLPDEPLANSLPTDIKKTLSFNNRYDEFKNFISNPEEKFIKGTGNNSTVYDLPNLDKYVLKVLKPGVSKNPNEIPIGAISDNINLGQPIWEHPENKRISILKKIPGEPHSTKNWSNIIWDKELSHPIEVTQQMAEDYALSIQKISEMEQTVFDKLALSLKILDTTPKYKGDTFSGFKVDSINPNNLMVDIKNKDMNIIDYFGKSKSSHQNSSTDITAIISDFTLMPEYYDKLSPEKQKALIQNIKTIDKKATDASKKAGLTTDRNIFKNYINDTSKYFYPPHIVSSNGKTYKRDYRITSQKLLDILEK